ncbi:MAG: sigma-70 family RNA polymerase sigma factor [Verrucomicrobiales bacterium]|nr:sigma-70 family RNA polymerase sigma factor [Verrucomicrobiales bacterium]
MWLFDNGRGHPIGLTLASGSSFAFERAVVQVDPPTEKNPAGYFHFEKSLKRQLFGGTQPSLGGGSIRFPPTSPARTESRKDDGFLLPSPTSHCHLFPAGQPFATPGMDPKGEIIEPSNDRQLAERCKNFDEDAWALLYDRWGEPVFRACYGATQNFHDAEDISGVVWNKISKNIGSFENQSSFRTWLYVIIGHEISNWLQKRGRIRRLEEPATHTEGSEEVEEEQHPSSAPNPADQTAARERLTASLEALKRLKTECQTVLSLAWEGFTDLAIANALQLNHKTVQSRRARCEAKFREAMQDYDRRASLPPGR